QFARDGRPGRAGLCLGGSLPARAAAGGCAVPAPQHSAIPRPGVGRQVAAYGPERLGRGGPRAGAAHPAVSGGLRTERRARPDVPCVAAVTFRAWRKGMGVGLCLDASLAVLAILAAHALHGAGQTAPPGLAGLMEEVLATVPPVETTRRVGPDCGALTAAFTARVFS